MKSLILILSIITLFSCNSDEGEEQFNYDVGFEFSVKDNQGNDLLNPENENSFNESEIKLFYKKNNTITEVYDNSLDNPRNFLIYQHEDNYRIRVFVNNSQTEEIPETYIHWNETEIDTIFCDIIRTNNLVRINKTWLNTNSNLIWNSADNVEPHFEIIK